MIAILGAGGDIGNKLVKLLAAGNQPFRLVGRNPSPAPGAISSILRRRLPPCFRPWRIGADKRRFQNKALASVMETYL